MITDHRWQTHRAIYERLKIEFPELDLCLNFERRKRFDERWEILLTSGHHRTLTQFKLERRDSSLLISRVEFAKYNLRINNIFSALEQPGRITGFSTFYRT